MANSKPKGKPILFISHMSSEVATAKELKAVIDECLCGYFSIFVSADPHSLPPGVDWKKKTIKSLKNSVVVLAILSRDSVNSRWVNFESGVAWVSDTCFIPCCIKDMKPNGLPVPYPDKQIADLSTGDGLKNLIDRLGKLTDKARVRVRREHDYELLAARIAATWASDPDFSTYSPAATAGLSKYFLECTKITVVGITNDQVALVMAEALASRHAENSLRVKAVEVFYSDLKMLAKGMPKEEEVSCPGTEMEVTKSRSSLGEEQAESIAKFNKLSGLGIEVSIKKYCSFPIAGIIAGDYQDRPGIIRVTHYIWGNIAGACPTMTLRRSTEPELYKKYVIYLNLLRKYAVD